MKGDIARMFVKISKRNERKNLSNLIMHYGINTVTLI
jgi:hypothetical protein